MRPMRCFVGPHRFVYVLRYDSAKRHILGLRTPAGGYDPQIPIRPRFLCSAPTPKFHHPMFTHSEVIVLARWHTNKPTNRRRRKHPTLFATLQRWVKSIQWETTRGSVLTTASCNDSFYYLRRVAAIKVVQQYKATKSTRRLTVVGVAETGRRGGVVMGRFRRVARPHNYRVQSPVNWRGAEAGGQL